MLLGRVVGTVVPCVVYEGLAGVPVLLVQPRDKKGAPKGVPLVAADSTRAAHPDSLWEQSCACCLPASSLPRSWCCR